MPMKVLRYGIVLERLNENHLEMVRHWRNDKKISKYMFHHGEITTEMQQEWFQSINNLSNFFFLIHYHNKPVGLINMSAIDWDKHEAYSGLFIYDDTFLGTDVPVRASLAMLDVFFLLAGIKKVYAKVRGNNKVAHRYNTALGFVRTRKIELGLGFEYELDRTEYFIQADKLRRLAEKIDGNYTEILFENTAIDNDLKKQFAQVSDTAKVFLGLKNA